MAKGEKFVDKYGVESAQIYKTADLSIIKIPGPDHFLYDPTAPTTFDELRVREIDDAGKMDDPITVYTDPDTKTLYALDGRGRTLDTTEVNRRRKEEGREPVYALLLPFSGTEKDAVARVRLFNYHRRTPTPSGMGLDILALRKAGWSWPDCAAKLHVESKDPEQWAKRYLPLAYCIEEVRAAFDARELPITMARKFGGGEVDGSAALGKKEQLALLQLTREAPATTKVKVVSPGKRRRLVQVLTNGASEKLNAGNKTVAQIVAATLAFVDGDPKMLRGWPDVAAIVEGTMKKGV